MVASLATFPAAQAMDRDPARKSTGARRSTRLTIGVPITVIGRDSHGQPFTEETCTTTINRHGGKVRLSHEVRLKDTLVIKNARLNRAVNSTVVWVGKTRHQADSWEVGIELVEAENIWGIEFPPHDWNEPVRQAANGAPDETAQSVLTIPIEANALPPVPPTARVESPSTEAQGPLPRDVAAPTAATQSMSCGPVSIPQPPKTLPADPPSGHAACSPEQSQEGHHSIPKQLAESLDAMMQKILATFEEELRSVARSHFRAFEGSILRAAVEKADATRHQLQENIPGLVQECLGELRLRAQQDLEDYATHLEEVRAEFRHSAPAMVQECTAALRRQAALDLEESSVTLRELQQQAIVDALGVLRTRLTKALQALDS